MLACEQTPVCRTVAPHHTRRLPRPPPVPPRCRRCCGMRDRRRRRLRTGRPAAGCRAAAGATHLVTSPVICDVISGGDGDSVDGDLASCFPVSPRFRRSRMEVEIFVFIFAYSFLDVLCVIDKDGNHGSPGKLQSFRKILVVEPLTIFWKVETLYSADFSSPFYIIRFV